MFSLFRSTWDSTHFLKPFLQDYKKKLVPIFKEVNMDGDSTVI